MQKAENTLPTHEQKPLTFGADKVSTRLASEFNSHSLTAWVHLYAQVHVKGAPEKTELAKQSDLAKFLNFYQREVGQDQVDSWTPAVTKHFQKGLTKTISPRTQKPYDPNTVNRIMATVRHFGRWLHGQRPLLAGDPLANVKDIQTDAPDWNGVSPRNLMRLKSACEQRLKGCTRKDQNPLLEIAVFYCLYGTGLRESELVALDVYQYHHKGFHNTVRRKNKRVSDKVPVPQEAREWLDRYLAERNAQPDEPLFLNRYGQRLTEKAVYRLCQRVLKQALAYVPEQEKFHFTPHKLRHTFLKRAADKHGIHYCFKASGNVSAKTIFNYTQPSQDELDEAVELLFEN
jgi:integrase/recombinase XerD